MPEPLNDDVRRRMRNQQRRDTALELIIRRKLHALGYRYRVDHRLAPPLRTRADMVFTRRMVAVFVDGCFWHGCPRHATAPKHNAAWWKEKIAGNIARDRRADEALRALGWTVVRVWEHVPPDEAVAWIVEVLDQADRNRS